MSFEALLTIILTLFLLMICGYVCRKKGIIDTVASKRLSSLIISVGQPMMIIAALNNAEYSKENLTVAWQVTLISFVMHVIMCGAAFLICRRMKHPDRAKIFEFSLIFANCGFIGFPIIESLYGEEGLFCGAFYLLGFHLFIWTWGMFILSRGRDDIKLTPKSIIVNYGTIPCIIGFVMFLVPCPFPQFVSQTASYIADICTPLTMLITGALIATGSMRDLFGKAGNYLVCVARLLVLPVIVCVILRLCGLSEFNIVFGTVMAAMPSAAVVTMFGEMYDINPGYASRLVGVTSMLCVVTLPLMVALAGYIAGV